MKKVLVMAAAIALFAGQAWALSTIVGSKHDMTSAGTFSTSTTEVCVFCHTPHGADTENPNAPLWNRSYKPAADSYTFYNSATLDTNSAGNAVSVAVSASDAPLCLSCHDGAAAVQSQLLNPPNSATPDWTSFTWTAPGAANITTDLSNDHPIGMQYNTIYTADTEGFNSLSEASQSGAVFYTKQNILWCSSCHDVHSDSYYPFLITDNAGSALCLACHNK